MANESGGLPVPPEVTKSPEVKLRRNSAGKASSGTSVEKNVPNYLRASTGSCHDFCKYGRKHEFDLKERRSIPNRATRKQLHLSASVDPKPTNRSVVKLKESADSKTWISDTSDIKESADKEVPTKSFDRQKEIENEVVVNRNKSSYAKVKPSLLKSNTSPSMRQEISSIKEVRSPSKLSPKKVGTPSKPTSRKVEATSKPTSRKVEAPSKSTPNEMKTTLKSTTKKVENPSKSTSKVKTSSKPTSNMVKTSSQLSSLNGKEMKLSEKRVTLNSSSVRKKQLSSVNPSEGFGAQRYNKIKTVKGATSSKAASRKLMASSKALSSPRPTLRRVASINSRKHKSLKIASHLQDQQTARKIENEEDNNEVEEKTLYVIKMEGENKTLPSDQNASYCDELYLPQLSSPKSSVSSISQSVSREDQEESEYTTSEFEQDSFSGNHEIECMENEETLEVEKKGKPRKGVVYSKDKSNQMIQLKFRRGKVVESQIEISSPRRLKFRRAKVPREKANVKGGVRKSFASRDEACDDSNGAGPEKVVLRHQDTQDKKDAQVLLNNVIEEAASKLVETRKSKVKALVGAFETVISLHEKKPSANSQLMEFG